MAYVSALVALGLARALNACEYAADFDRAGNAASNPDATAPHARSEDAD